ncbi:MAG: type II toxin-antitoxin system HicB family antitoxin [Clostridia bacterium]|nr:type II toxin-antitoxin system HicB family antitoxin [Clostridia bacterium]MBR6511959.1 type II toxin-antitoxin system HicB family antitoxin [Clostridia bacterium]
MKCTYPIVLTPDESDYVVYIPDFDANTSGKTLADAIEMARDAIGIMGIVMEDDGKRLPKSSTMDAVRRKEGEIVTLVDVDFTEYRRRNERRVVKKNCTLPSWLCYEAEKANINFSQVLQAALKRELGIA